MNKLTAVLAVAAVLTLGGCGSSGEESPAPAAAPTLGCISAATDELFVSKFWECTDDTTIREFADTTARDNWWKAAEPTGSVKVAEGTNWIKAKR